MAFLPALPRLASLAARKAADMLFPPRCFSCGGMTGGGGLCAPCWEKVAFIAEPCCARCGIPFPYEMGAAAVECMGCLTQPPPFAKARASFVYDDGSRRLITSYKYYDRTHATPMFAGWLARTGKDMLEDADVLMPVPMHRWRLLRRRYNQSALLTVALGKVADRRVALNALRRVRHTPQQAGLTREQRLQNVQGAFCIPPRHQPVLTGKVVVLVDDVFTTGATLNACAKALLEAGAAEVRVLTLARTVGDEV